MFEVVSKTNKYFLWPMTPFGEAEHLSPCDLNLPPQNSRYKIQKEHNLMTHEIIKLIVPLVLVALLLVLRFYVLQKDRSRLKRLLSVIDGRISGLIPTLKGMWRGHSVIIGYRPSRRTRFVYITLHVQNPWPFSAFLISVNHPIGPMCVPLKTYMSGRSFEILEAYLKVYPIDGDKPQIASFLTPNRLKIIHDLFEQDFPYLEINQSSPAGSYIKIGFIEAYFGLLSLFSKSKSDSVLQPKVIDRILNKLKDF
jgi:hypothetical protein